MSQEQQEQGPIGNIFTPLTAESVNSGIVKNSFADGEEERDEVGLRPDDLNQFVGQTHVRNQMTIAIQAAQDRKEALDHVLLSGPPGLGKTSMARIIAKEMGAEFVQTAGPSLERKADVAALLTSLQPGSVFFIDELHRLPKALEETLYPAMEDRQLPVTIGQGPGARVVNLDLPQFTLVGATTRASLLSRPLRDRFGMHQRLELYEAFELGQILTRASALLNVELEQDAAQLIAARSRGTPRVAIRLLKRVRDYVQVRSLGRIETQDALEAMELLGVDELGLERTDRSLLLKICNNFDGGPVGLSTLAASVGEDSSTLEEVHEPFLLQQGLLKRTPRGRIATKNAYAHMGITISEAAKERLG